MKNENILPGQIVPEDIRLEVYKEALEKIGTTYGYFGLCLALPMILWGLKSYLEYAPNRDIWDWKDTETMFPEIAGIREAVDNESNKKEQVTIRIQYLESAIAKLSNKS